jgi:hypothetical protein
VIKRLGSLIWGVEQASISSKVIARYFIICDAFVSIPRHLRFDDWFLLLG